MVPEISLAITLVAAPIKVNPAAHIEPAQKSWLATNSPWIVPAVTFALGMVVHHNLTLDDDDCPSCPAPARRKCDDRR